MKHIPTATATNSQEITSNIKVSELVFETVVEMLSQMQWGAKEQRVVVEIYLKI